MSKLRAVILVYDDHTQIAEDDEALNYDQKMRASAAILHGRVYNPFTANPVQWTEAGPDAHAWWKALNKRTPIQP